MPYVQNNQIKIHFKEEGNGPPLVLQHGLTSNLENWYGTTKRSSYVDHLKNRYHLILIDARGHGKSSKPHNPHEYAIQNMVSDVVTVLNHLDIEKAAFWGYSMGGYIGLAALKYAPKRLSSMIIGGYGLSEKDSEERVEQLQLYTSLFKRGTEAFIANREERTGQKLSETEKENWMNVDFEAFVAYCSYFENIGMVDYLPDVRIPCLFYAGENDDGYYQASKTCANVVPNSSFVSLPDLDHLGAIYNNSTILPNVIRFLDK